MSRTGNKSGDMAKAKEWSTDLLAHTGAPGSTLCVGPNDASGESGLGLLSTPSSSMSSDVLLSAATDISSSPRRGGCWPKIGHNADYRGGGK